jgi:hypothetical protein
MKPAPDYKYITERNKLIPEAEHHADKMAKGLIHLEERRMVWNTAFFAEMDRLWKERTQ